ncbi:succinyl-diaminopimelate desuccinylase [Corynebacterium sp.]|uniref:succinyl-diaminopimelate desuccinylase n=1 Tax=Corynebacterium sp. TaxID=1720 RepID=UPI0026DEE213|nr:succinyl-diaminopimelate desuccinylase [Corynebacterium sp.]MDO5512279.1 succinyl-diaminopimelate desuccinylase [Corynebacterium sp.]
MKPLNLTQDPVALTAALVDIPSPSHQEKLIADLVEQALIDVPGVQVIRRGNTVAARTDRGLPERVVLAGHLDTVPIADNVPHHMVDDIMYGCGTVDMKSGLAVYLHLFATLANSPDLAFDLTVIAYECEEVDSRYNGLGHLADSDPEWLQGDLALLGEPSGAIVEAGCQGTLRVRVTTRGRRAHSARGWLGDNAAHKLAPAIARIAEWDNREVDIDGCIYREGLNVVKLESYLATNIIPDEAHALVNYRFAPDLSAKEALARVEKHLDGFEVTVEDAVAGALPGLDKPAAAALIARVGEVKAKYGWTDVARFAALGIPAVNFGPGDPSFAHRQEEQVPVEHITRVAAQLRDFLAPARPAGND